MKEAGCYKITIGVESGNEKIRYATGKLIDNEKFVEVFNMCNEIGIKTMANFIIGHPNEAIKDVLETIKFSIKLRPFNVLYTKMTPLPDVDLYFILRNNKRISADIWYKYMKNQIPFPVYYPETIGKPTMELLYRFAYIVFYFRPSSLFKYAKIFSDFRFAYLSLKVTLRFIFGKTIYK
jgi:radical SAM superfamily enzyme YgiQ (UPF0313 family)